MIEINKAEAIRDLSTIKDFIRWSMTQFRKGEVVLGHGTDDPWDEALALIFYALNLPWGTDKGMQDATLTTSEKELVVKLVKERVERRLPVAYITHEAWFAGLPFFVDERVLVPRSPIAELIENQFMPWIDGACVRRVLDLCTGSGCIAAACAVAFPDASIDGVDISRDALDVASINVANLALEDRVTLKESDLFDTLLDRYDIIVSNPPYVDAADMAELAEEYRHEPVLGLEAGDDGLMIVRQILAEAHNYLMPHGILLVEVGNSQEALENAFPELPFTWLEFERGGHGVFLLTAKELAKV